MIINGNDYNRLFELAKTRIHEKVEGIKSKEEMISEEGNILIVSEGHAFDTEVYCNGKRLRNVTSVAIDEILPGEPLRARIEVYAPRLHLRANCE